MSDSTAPFREEGNPTRVRASVPEARRYRVFLSYSHADTKWARWLMRKLELYWVPKRFQGRIAPIGEVGRRIAPVFRDRDELPTTSDLGETIRGALRESATLVVICSPASAKSRWVQEEITAFKRLHGERAVFAFIVSGEPKVAGAADDCFSPALRAEVDADGQLSGKPAEVVAADARAEGDGPKVAFVRLVAGLLGVGFDELRQRELQRRNRRLMIVAACSAAGMALTLGLAVFAWQARNDAVSARNDAQRRQDQAEDVLAFMLGDFRGELKRVGRLDLLTRVGDKAMEYFDSLDSRDLTDTALARQSKAFTQIGENRMEQARYAEAVRAFLNAYTRATALAARHVRNGDFLFERGQAEYWIGFVHLKRGDLGAAADWFSHYRNTAKELMALDAGRTQWQGELAWGHHNVAVVDMGRGRMDAARQGFAAELTLLKKMTGGGAPKLDLEYRIADAHSWQANAAERDGDLREAAGRYAEYVSRLEAIVGADPGTARWRARLADSLALHAGILAITGDKAGSLRQRTRATSMLEALVAADAENRVWLRSSLYMRLKEVSLLRADGNVQSAAKILRETREQLEKLSAAQPTDRELRQGVGAAWRIEADLRDTMGEAAAAAASRRAIELLEAVVAEDRANEEILGSLAQAWITAGRIARSAGDHETAHEQWHRALALMESRARHSNYWRTLDPTARAMILLGREEEGRAIMTRLQAQGYQPLEAWPSVSAQLLQSTHNPTTK